MTNVTTTHVTKKFDMQTSLRRFSRAMQICIRRSQKTSLLFEIMDSTKTTGRGTVQSLK